MTAKTAPAPTDVAADSARPATNDAIAPIHYAVPLTAKRLPPMPSFTPNAAANGSTTTDSVSAKKSPTSKASAKPSKASSKRSPTPTVPSEATADWYERGVEGPSLTTLAPLAKKVWSKPKNARELASQINAIANLVLNGHIDLDQARAYSSLVRAVGQMMSLEVYRARFLKEQPLLDFEDADPE